MPYYVPAYDTEAVYPWWEHPTGSYSQVVSYEGEALRECLAGVRAVAEVHLKLQAPATFFLVGELVRHAAGELRALLDQPLFDIQCHSYTHATLTEIADDAAALRHELADSKALIEDTFARPVIGLTTPAAFTRGLLGLKLVLEVVVDAGYRYVRSVGRGPFETVPAPLTQPFWYTDEGYPDLLELGLHAWHDNALTGQPAYCHWPPTLPWGYPTHAAQSAEEVYQAYAPGIDYITEHQLLTYIPCFHPWSVYRVSREARQIQLLLNHARRVMTLASCSDVYAQTRAVRSLASEHPPAAIAQPEPLPAAR